MASPTITGSQPTMAGRQMMPGQPGPSQAMGMQPTAAGMGGLGTRPPHPGLPQQPQQQVRGTMDQNMPWQ